MRCFIQRVTEASVSIAGKQVATIGAGLLVLIGIGNEDDFDTINSMVKKITQLRIFYDEQGKMNHSVVDVGGDILLVSQFTLFADCKKGNRPSFILAAQPQIAQTHFDDFYNLMCTKMGNKVHKGVFGANMQVQLINDGPVSIWLDSNDL